MSFDPDWLALRADADRRARSHLVQRFAERADAMPRPLRIVDLGAGTGATVRELSPRMRPPQHWTLVDADAALLAEAEAGLAGRPGLAVTVRRADLTVDPPWDEAPDLVTASALFDIVPETFVSRIAGALARKRIPLLAMLTYDGRLRVTPEHPFDGAMIDAFNAHQRGEKSFGAALGPDAADALTAALRKAGAHVEEAESPWDLAAPADSGLMQAKLDGWAAAAREIMPDEAAAIADWREARREAEAIFVGHRDHLATF